MWLRKNSVACNEAERPWKREEVVNFNAMFQNLPGDNKQKTETGVVDFEDVQKRKQQCIAASSLSA
jgi:hypothetical protein